MPFLTISSYLMPGSMSRAIMVIRSLISVYFIYLYTAYQYFSKADAVFFLAHITVLVSTALHGGQMVNQLYRTLSVIGFCAMCVVNLKRDQRNFLKAVSIYGSVMTALTVITMFVYYKPGTYEGGMRLAGTRTSYGRMISGSWYLLGLDNSSFLYIFPVLIVLYLYLLVYRKKAGWGYFAFYALVTSAFFYVRSATAAVCFLLGGILLAAAGNEKIRRFIKSIDYRKAIWIIILFAVFIVYFRLQYYFEFLIVNILGKNLTLTRRTQIWDLAFQEIAKHPILGIGAQSDLYNFRIFRVNHVHNIILEWLYEGGITALALFTASIVLFGKKIRKYRSNRIATVLSGAVAIYLLNTCLDYYTYVFLPYALLIFVEHCDDLIFAYNSYSEILRNTRA